MSLISHSRNSSFNTDNNIGLQGMGARALVPYYIILGYFTQE